jgi:hypothetical protein
VLTGGPISPRRRIDGRRHRAALDSGYPEPWPGLAAYDEASRDFFNGRDADTEELLRLVRLAPLTVLYGKSGLGKSSLLQAGLFPRLRQVHDLPIYIRLDISQTADHSPLDQAARRLREELTARGADFPEFEPGESLWHYLHRRDLELWSHDNNLLTPVLVFDQFEEIFTRGGFDVERVSRLCHELADLIENRIPTEVTSGGDVRRTAARLDVFSQRYRIVLSFREDFLPDIKNWERDVPSLLKNWHQLQPMNQEQAVAAVQSGTAVLAPGAADAIVNFVGNLEQTHTEGDSSIEPVLLSLCCYQLNLRRKQRQAVLIDATLVGEEGQDILQDFYTKALAAMPKTVSRFIEDHLIQGNHYRGSYPEDDAIENGFITPEQLDELTSRHRLLRIDRSQRRTARIELIHDRLVGVVRQARDLRLTTERQLEEEAQRRRELEVAQTLAVETEKRRLAEEQRAEEAEARVKDRDAAATRLRNRAWALGVIAVIAVILAVVSAIFYWQANTQRKISLSRQLAAQARAITSRNIDLLQRKVLLAGTSLRLAYTPEATQILYEDLFTLPVGGIRISHQGAVRQISFSPDSRYVATRSEDETAQVWELSSKQALFTIPHQGAVSSLSFSPDSRYVATGSEDKTAQVSD